MIEAIAGRYELTDELADAGPVTVHAADDRWLRRSVALAVCHPRSGTGGPGASPADEAQFRATGRALARLAHPHVADTYDLGRHEGGLFVAFERPRDDLAAELSAGEAWDQARVARLAAELTDAVDGLHRAGACHGSLHPGSVGLGPDGQVRVTPWPVAPPPPGWGGPRGWLAPERIAGDAPSVRADLWSLAAVLLCSLVGPGPGALDDEGLAEVTGRLRRSVDPALLGVISRALVADPLERYASAGEMKAALEPRPTEQPWIPAAPLAPPAIRVRPLDRLGPPIRRLGWGGAAALVAAVAVPLATLQIEAAPPSPASCIKQTRAGGMCAAHAPTSRSHRGRHHGGPAPTVVEGEELAHPAGPPTDGGSSAAPTTGDPGGAQPVVAVALASPPPPPPPGPHGMPAGHPADRPATAPGGSPAGGPGTRPAGDGGTSASGGGPGQGGPGQGGSGQGPATPTGGSWAPGASHDGGHDSSAPGGALPAQL